MARRMRIVRGEKYEGVYKYGDNPRLPTVYWGPYLFLECCFDRSLVERLKTFYIESSFINCHLTIRGAIYNDFGTMLNKEEYEEYIDLE